MGTTLTGTTPQDTYDSLIKVTDNGPLSGTAKYLSDGLGNDSVLALSTARVGIGTASPSNLLDIQSSSSNPTTRIASTGGVIGNYAELVLQSFNSLSGVGQSFIRGISTATGNSNTDLVFGVNASGFGAPFEAMRINNLGNVGIGSAAATGARLESYVSTAGSTPPAALRLQNTGAGYQAKMVLTDGNTNDANIVYQGGFTGDSQYLGIGLGSSVNDLQITGSRYIRLASGTGGIQFNGDTAAANALDDYEEGTWTMGISFGNASTGITYTINTGTYTKIGRQVTVQGYLTLSSKGSASGGARITGLPFTISNNAAAYSAAAMWLNNISFANQYNAISQIGTTNIELYEVTEAGTFSALTDADFTNASEVIFSMSYIA